MMQFCRKGRVQNTHLMKSTCLISIVSNTEILPFLSHMTHSIYMQENSKFANSKGTLTDK